MEKLIQVKANVNLANRDGQTPLMAVAAAEQSVLHSGRTAQALLRARADPTARDDSGRTALDIARAKGAESVIRLLDPAGAEKAQLQRAEEAAAKHRACSGHECATIADRTRTFTSRSLARARPAC